MWLKEDDFSGQVAVITGGSRGIGLATARLFLDRGAKVAICARNPENLQAAEKKLGRAGEIEAVLADVRDISQIQNFIDRAHERFGRIDVLVNNAGRVTSGQFADQPLESIDEIIDVNLKGVLYSTRAVLPVMLAQQSGVIVSVSSGAGLAGFAGLVTYCASKFGVTGFTESLSREVLIHGIRVYAVCPGRVATEMQQEYSGRRQGMPPERVADKILRLAGRKPPVDPGKCLTVS